MTEREGRPDRLRTAHTGRALSRESLAATADNALRCAWLRVHAELLYDVDPTGQLSAQLLDLADLLEAVYGSGGR